MKFINYIEKVSGVDICELYLGDKDYLCAEVMQYKLKDSYIKKMFAMYLICLVRLKLKEIIKISLN